MGRTYLVSLRSGGGGIALVVALRSGGAGLLHGGRVAGLLRGG